jgi:hypothetical protein
MLPPGCASTVMSNDGVPRRPHCMAASTRGSSALCPRLGVAARGRFDTPTAGSHVPGVQVAGLLVVFDDDKTRSRALVAVRLPNRGPSRPCASLLHGPQTSSAGKAEAASAALGAWIYLSILPVRGHGSLLAPPLQTSGQDVVFERALEPGGIRSSAPSAPSSRHRRCAGLSGSFCVRA